MCAALIQGTGTANTPAMIITGHFDRVPIAQAIRPQGVLSQM